MNKHIKRMMIQSVLGLMLILSFTLISYPDLVANWRECLNTPGCSCTLQGTTSTLKIYITESAGYFLNSHSAYQTFLNRVEMADVKGIDFIELKDILYNSTAYMEKAKAAYANVKAASEKI
ncbi:MAG: hypothetical protein MUF15_24085, partial [Acidobacteria bacterium]|nr:hypothetical protein [Acidobacteriota bacterium]